MAPAVRLIPYDHIVRGSDTMCTAVLIIVYRTLYTKPAPVLERLLSLDCSNALVLCYFLALFSNLKEWKLGITVYCHRQRTSRPSQDTYQSQIHESCPMRALGFHVLSINLSSRVNSGISTEDLKAEVSPRPEVQAQEPTGFVSTIVAS
jgi:hypothetical protein